ncbi:hypothetical protein ACJJTC_016785 [Scirpophaga incertulas]
MEKSLKRKIVDAAAAVKKKVRQMRDIETDRAQALETVFQRVYRFKRSENSDDDYASESLHNKGSESSDVDDEGEHESDIHSTSSYESVLEENQDFDTSSWSVYSEALKDIPFGVRVERDKLMLTINLLPLVNLNIKINLVLKQLLLKEHVDLRLITPSDMQIT